MSGTTALMRGGLPVTGQQAAIVDSVVAGGVTVVGAGAGAGKTHTTVAAVLELLDRGASADRFVLITFTNKAADELHRRLQGEVGVRVHGATGDERRRWADQQERLSAAYVGTIHGFALQILRTYGYGTGLPRTLRMTMSRRALAEALQDARETALELGTAPAALGDAGVPEHELLALTAQIFAAARGQGVSLDELARRTADQPADIGKRYREAMCALLVDVQARYADAKQRNGLADADDLLTKLAELLTDPAQDVAQRVAARAGYLFVDEFQDTDRTQKQIVDALTPHLESVLVVGDKKQSIYRFRSALPSLLDEMARDHNLDVMPLSVSRRPTRQLLDAQNALFARIAERYPDVGEPLEPHEGTLTPDDPLPPFIVVPSSPSTEHPRAVADVIRELLGRPLVLEADEPPDEVRAGDIAVLARTNGTVERMTERLGVLLGPYGVAVRADRGVAFFERPEVVATYRILRLLVRYPDDGALSMALRTPYLAEAGDPAQRERDILQYGIQRGTPLTDWFEGDHPEVADVLARLRRAARTDTAPQILGRLYDDFGVRARYERARDPAAVAGLELLRERARALFSNEQALTLRTFTDWLGTAILGGYDVEDPAQVLTGDARRPPHVRVTTIHRAKGLEFPIVVIPGIAAPVRSEQFDPEFLFEDDGLDLRIPDARVDTRSPQWQSRMRAEDAERRAEEIRVLYVAATRAEQCVVVVGGGTSTPRDPDDDFYAWRDEIYRARQDLEGCGAEFRT